MSLINPAMLLGLGLVAIPVLLHFLMRARPKKLLFPALQLIQVRRKTNARRMRLRHLWLLLLRIFVIGLLVLAVARPSLPPANYAPTLREGLFLAGIVVVCLAAYFALMWRWRRQSLARADFLYRRTLLRGGLAVAGILALLLLVAWPYQQRVSAEIRAPVAESVLQLPAAAVFLFDNSRSMEYLAENQTRLELAREVANAHLTRLPSRSRVAVLDTSTAEPAPLQADLSAAKSRINQLETADVSIPLNVRLQTAIDLQSQDRGPDVTEGDREDPFLREIYLFTDLQRSSWSESGAELLKERLEEADWLQVYVVDVGAEQPVNVAITDLILSKEAVSATEELVVEAQLLRQGAATDFQTVELHLPNDEGELVKRDQRLVDLSDDERTSVLFQVRGLKGPLVQGNVRLEAAEPLTVDNRRDFTVAVHPTPRVLIVGPSRNEVQIWRETLAPTELVQLGRAPYDCRFLPTDRLENAELAEYSVVSLVNARELSPAAWRRLADFVQRGGGLMAVLGSRDLNMVSYNSAAARDVMPVVLSGAIRFREPVTLDVAGNGTHPVLAPFTEVLGGFGELTTAEIERCWSCEPAPDARTIISYTDRRSLPALVERRCGQGRSMALTTAIDAGGWNSLQTTWQLMALADHIMQYLGQRSEVQVNFTTGDDVLLRVPPPETDTSYVLRKPGFEQVKGEWPAGTDVVLLTDCDEAGHYRFAEARDGGLRTGFSMNRPADESDLSRLSVIDLSQYLGENRFSLARRIEELDRAVRRGRMGQEMYAWVLGLLIGVFGLELLVANRFYEIDQDAPVPTD